MRIQVIIYISFYFFSIQGCAQSKEFRIEKYPPVSAEIIEKLEKKLVSNPKNTAVRNDLIVAYIKNRFYEKARNLLAQSLNENPDNINSNYLMGLVCMRQSLPDEAKMYYEKVLSLNPNHSESIFNLAAIAQYNSNYEKAKNLYQKALEINPNDGDAHYNLAILYDKRFFDYKNAMYHYRRCVDIYRNKNLKQQLVQLVKNRIEELKSIEESG